MSIKIRINSCAESFYRYEAEQYQILDVENKIISDLEEDEIYELKDGEKLICWYNETMDHEEYVRYNPLSIAEQKRIDGIKGKIILNSFEYDFDEQILEGILNSEILEEFKRIRIIIRNLSDQDLEFINNEYKIKSTKLSEIDSKYSIILAELKVEQKDVDCGVEDEICNEDLKIQLKLGFIYTFDAIRDKIKYLNTTKNRTMCDNSIYSGIQPVRYIDGQLIPMIDDMAFMNLADVLNIEINDDICEIHGSQECA